MTKTPPPLGRSEGRDVLDWSGVEPAPRPAVHDGLGLRAEDRQALGMSHARHAAAPAPGPADAHAALSDLLHRGVALGKGEQRPRRKG